MPPPPHPLWNQAHLLSCIAKSGNLKLWRNLCLACPSLGRYILRENGAMIEAKRRFVRVESYGKADYSYWSCTAMLNSEFHNEDDLPARVHYNEDRINLDWYQHGLHWRHNDYPDEIFLMSTLFPVSSYRMRWNINRKINFPTLVCEEYCWHWQCNDYRLQQPQMDIFVAQRTEDVYELRYKCCCGHNIWCGVAINSTWEQGASRFRELHAATCPMSTISDVDYARQVEEQLARTQQLVSDFYRSGRHQKILEDAMAKADFVLRKQKKIKWD